MQNHQEFDKARLNPQNQIELEPPSKYCLQFEEIQQIKCKICYDTGGPLVSLCNCIGSIGYVHQNCILDWITKKMEISQNIEIPSCQICRSRYSARMSIGRKKLCYSLLGRKVKSMKVTQILQTLISLIGVFTSCYQFINGIILLGLLIGSLFSSENNGIQFKPISWLCTGIYYFFIYVVLPASFCLNSKKQWRMWRQIIQTSMIQIVEVTLLPKITFN